MTGFGVRAEVTSLAEQAIGFWKFGENIGEYI
jgi:hypothetical protein